MSALPPIATTKADMPVAKGGKVMDGRLSDKQVARTIKAKHGHATWLRSQRGDFPGSRGRRDSDESAL